MPLIGGEIPENTGKNLSSFPSFVNSVLETPTKSAQTPNPLHDTRNGLTSRKESDKTSNKTLGKATPSQGTIPAGLWFAFTEQSSFMPLC